MKLPKKIKVGGIVYDIEITKVPDVPPLCKNHADGQVDYDKCKIFIDESLPQQLREQVLFHEIIHAIEYNNNFESEERIIQTFASNLYQVIKDNKMLKE